MQIPNQEFETILKKNFNYAPTPISDLFHLVKGARMINQIIMLDIE